MRQEFPKVVRSVGGGSKVARGMGTRNGMKG